MGPSLFLSRGLDGEKDERLTYVRDGATIHNSPRKALAKFDVDAFFEDDVLEEEDDVEEDADEEDDEPETLDRDTDGKTNSSFAPNFEKSTQQKRKS